MGDSGSKEPSGDQREQSDAFQRRLAYGVEALQELLNLLEQYAPTWYTEEHHRRASRALRGLEEARQLAKGRLTPGLERGDVGVLADKKKEDSRSARNNATWTGMTDSEGEIAVTREL